VHLKVQGNFDCSNNKLTSLEGAPKTVDGSFNCNNNELTSLEGSPDIVKGAFYCRQNKLVSLNGLKGIENIPAIGCQLNINPHLKEELKLRQENPKMSEEDINIKMYELTQMEHYLPQEAKDIFLF